MSAFQRTSEAGGSDEGREQVHGHLDQENKTDAGEIAESIFEWIETKNPKSFTQADEDALNRMLDELEEADPELDEESVEASLADFYLKFAPLFEQAEQTVSKPKPVAPAPASEKRFRPFSKRLILLVAAIVLVLLLMVPARAAVFDFLNFIARTTAEIFRFDRSDAVYAMIEKYPIAEGEEATYATLQEALDAFGITAPLAPNEVPERFGEPTVTAVNIAKGVCIYADFESGENFLNIRFNEFDGRDLRTVEKDLSQIITYDYGGIQHFIVEDKDVLKATWQNGALECCITGTISEQEARDIIKSIY